MYQASAPIFSTPAVNPAASTMIVAAVNGSMTCLSHAGQPMWQCNLGGHTYAPICLLPAAAATAGGAVNAAAEGRPEADIIPADSQLPGSVCCGKPQHTDMHQLADAVHCYPVSMPHQGEAPGPEAATAAAGASSSFCKPFHAPGGLQEAGAAACTGRAVMVGSAEGKLHCISTATGKQLWTVSMRASISLAAAWCPCTFTQACSHASTEVQSQVHTKPDTQTQTETETETETQPEMHTQAQAQAQVQVQAPATLQAQAQIEHSNLLVTCTNSGALRVLHMPAVNVTNFHKETSPHSDDRQSDRHQGDSVPSCRDLLTHTVAAVQMPGRHAGMFCTRNPVQGLASLFKETPAAATYVVLVSYSEACAFVFG